MLNSGRGTSDTRGFLQAVTDMNANVFRHNDVAFFQRVTDNEDALANLEEAAIPYGGLAALAGRLGVAEMFLQQLFGVPRIREKLAVLEFWLAFHDEAMSTQVRTLAWDLPGRGGMGNWHLTMSHGSCPAKGSHLFFAHCMGTRHEICLCTFRALCCFVPAWLNLGRWGSPDGLGPLSFC